MFKKELEKHPQHKSILLKKWDKLYIEKDIIGLRDDRVIKLNFTLVWCNLVLMVVPCF